MLNSVCMCLLDFFNRESKEFCYKVYEIQYLLKVVPFEKETNKESVLEAVKILKQNEFISVKYNDGKELCLCVLDKGKEYFNSIFVHNGGKKNTALFLCAFTGGFLGGALSIALLILLVFLGVL